MFPLRDNIPSYRKPYVTKLIIFVNVAVYLYQFILPDNVNRALVFNYGFVPANLTRDIVKRQLTIENFYPLFSSMFLHGSFFHLISNMWTLWLFGDNVEDVLGHFKYIIFYFATGAAAMFFHFISYPNSVSPAIGASGAIAGVMGAYFILFPHSKIVTFFIPIFIIPLFVKIPAVIYLGIWFLSQLFNGTIGSIGGGRGSNVAWWAHIGGFVSGIFLLKLMYKKRYRRPIYYE